MKTMFSSNPIVLEKFFFLKETIFIPLTWIGIRFLIEETNRDSSRVHKKTNPSPSPSHKIKPKSQIRTEYKNLPRTKLALAPMTEKATKGTKDNLQHSGMKGYQKMWI